MSGVAAGLNSAIRTNAPPIVNSSQPGGDPLSIGGITFRTEECPNDLPVGGVKQMTVMRTLPGGTRIVSTFGPEPSNIEWSGNLYGTNVDTRIQALRLYTVSAQRVLLLWHNEAYNVVITSFEPTYHNRWRATYTIALDVVSDANGAFSIPAGVNIDQQVQGLLNMALTQNNVIWQFDQTGAAPFQSPLVNVQSAIGAAGPLARATSKSIAGITSAINTAQGYVSKYSNYLNALAPGAAPQLANALQLGSTLTNIAATVTRGQQPKAQVVQGGSLFGIAAQNFGDPTLAFQLAQVNGLLSPWMTGSRQTSITLPPLLGIKIP